MQARCDGSFLVLSKGSAKGVKWDTEFIGHYWNKQYFLPLLFCCFCPRENRLKLQVHYMLSHTTQTNSASLLDASRKVLYAANKRIANQLWKQQKLLVCFVLNLLSHLHLFDLALEGQYDPCLIECLLYLDFFMVVMGLSFHNWNSVACHVRCWIWTGLSSSLVDVFITSAKMDKQSENMF